MAKNRHSRLCDPTQWVDLHGNYLYHFALGRLRNPELAENAVQETFLAALEGKEKFSGRSSERTWLIGILKHKIVDHFRKKYREVPVTDLQSDQETLDSFFDQTDHPKKFPSDWLPDQRRLLGNKEFWQTFENCLKALPKTTADAFSLRELDDMKGEEICKVLKISPTNLWVMLHRARLQLRHCLEINWFEK